jgi:hypothetical protein
MPVLPTVYSAHYGFDDSEWFSCLFRWPLTGGDLAPATVIDGILAQPGLAGAMRVAGGVAKPHALLFVTSPVELREALHECCGRIVSASQPAGIAAAADGDQYDQWAEDLPPYHLHVDHRGYRYGDRPVACDFRLYPFVGEEVASAPFAYQFHFQAYRPDADAVRGVRKYLAWLDVEQPFSDSVRAMQATLIARLERPGVEVEEFFAADSPAALERLEQTIEHQFTDTTGSLGFPHAPLERDDFSPWMMSGVMPSARLREPSSLPARAAAYMATKDAVQLFSIPASYAASRKSSGSSRVSGAGDRVVPEVFISYASGDFAHAMAACRALEDKGIACWIAPRNINETADPYPVAISRALAGAKAVVVILSDTTNLSVHVPREVDIALERRLLIVPMRLQDIAPSGQLSYLLRTCQWLDAFERDFSGVVAELLARLGAMSRSQS